jgi:hypothetical protein
LLPSAWKPCPSLAFAYPVKVKWSGRQNNTVDRMMTGVTDGRTYLILTKIIFSHSWGYK